MNRESQLTNLRVVGGLKAGSLYRLTRWSGYNCIILGLHSLTSFASGLVPLSIAALLYGCTTPPDSPSPGPVSGSGFGSGSGSGGGLPVSTLVDARPAALVQGQSVTWGELRPLLNETAGGTALAEIILERRLRPLLAESNLVITGSDTDSERKTLLESLDRNPEPAARLLEKLRKKRGLGPQRFRGLLWRNAALRALVRDRVEITEEKITLLRDLIYGEKRQPRLLTVPSLRKVESVRERLAAGEAFMDLAVTRSTDASAARGGLLEPISRSDENYPPALRTQLWRMTEREISPPLLLNDQYALIMLVRILPPTEMPAAADPRALERLLRRREESRLMDALARRLLDDVSITIFDPSLHAGWKARTGWSTPGRINALDNQ